jgi:hypothetical protein
VKLLLLFILEGAIIMSKFDSKMALCMIWFCAANLQHMQSNTRVAVVLALVSLGYSIQAIIEAHKGL